MLAWRLLLATGDPECADVIERTLLQRRPPGALAGRHAVLLRQSTPAPDANGRGPDPAQGERAPWYACACCPPNLMRTIASFPQFLATHDADGIQIHQYVDGDVEADLAGGRVACP